MQSFELFWKKMWKMGSFLAGTTYNFSVQPPPPSADEYSSLRRSRV